jgi:signal transduction histidine kinase
MVDGVGQLTDAVWRESGDPPERIDVVNLSENALTNLEFRSDVTIIEYDCRKASIEGRLSRFDAGPEGSASLVLDVSGRNVCVNMDGDVPKWIGDEAAYAPLLRVVGIARYDMSGVAAHGRRPWPNALVIEANGDGGATLVPDAEWRGRKLAHAAQVVFNLLALLPVVLLVVGAVIWRRAIYRRRRRELLSVERRRMADDLHDTIEQHLAGAKILLSTAADKLGKDGAAAERAVKMAGEVLAEAKHQIRDVILNLRSDEFVAESAEDLILRMAKDINDRGIARVRVMLRGVPESLNVGAKVDLVAIVRQAVTNGIKHGGAKNVVIVCDPVADGRTEFCMRILNDGEPFDVAKALGPESGHFGLSNMRERAKRSGMDIGWAMEGKWTCVKVWR